MNDREKVARHEAAHAVLAIRTGFGVNGGIDLDAPTSSALRTSNVASGAATDVLRPPAQAIT